MERLTTKNEFRFKTEHWHLCTCKFISPTVFTSKVSSRDASIQFSFMFLTETCISIFYFKNLFGMFFLQKHYTFLPVCRKPDSNHRNLTDIENNFFRSKLTNPTVRKATDKDHHAAKGCETAPFIRKKITLMCLEICQWR